jgi:ABC-type methionine transport system permease subunit
MIRHPKNQLIKELLNKHKKPLRKWPFIIGLIILTGIILSICDDQWNWLSRSGALVVICGLLIARWDFTSKINEEDLDSFLPSIIRNIKANYGTVTPQMIENVKKDLRVKMIEYTKPQYISMEFIIIAFGIFVWGFGDLIGDIIK